MTQIDTTTRTDRKFAVSANRGKARHRLRYVETGGAAVDTGECAFCDSTPDLTGAVCAASGGDELLAGRTNEDRVADDQPERSVSG